MHVRSGDQPDVLPRRLRGGKSEAPRTQLVGTLSKELSRRPLTAAGRPLEPTPHEVSATSSGSADDYMTMPTGTVRNGRTKSGRFARGNPGGPGRPRGCDFRAVVTAHVEAEGRSIEEILVDVFKAIFARACEGDVQAARLLLDRLCAKEPDPVEIAPEYRELTDIERAIRIESILASARKRQEAAAKLRAEGNGAQRGVVDDRFDDP